MPDASVGTPKHFRCLSVSGLSPGGVVVIYQNHDLTGDACIANDTGVWASPNDELSNAVDTNPANGNFTLCRRSGQSSAGTEPIAVAGTACFDLEDTGTIDISANLQSAFPDINNAFWYSNDATAGSDDGLRRLANRGQDFRAPTGGRIPFLITTPVLSLTLFQMCGQQQLTMAYCYFSAKMTMESVWETWRPWTIPMLKPTNISLPVALTMQLETQTTSWSFN